MIYSDYKYYKSLLKYKNDHTIYELILDGISKHQRSIIIDNMLFGAHRSPLSVILDYVLLDNPGIFYIDTSSIRIKTGSKNRSIIINYLYSDDEIQKYENKIKQKVNIIVNIGKMVKFPSEYEWELYMHDLLAVHVNYEKENKSYHKLHSIMGPLLYGRSVCEGYSKAFKLLCDAVGIPCIVINGTADRDEMIIGGNHSWNIVKIEKTYYHVDVTWDSCTKINDNADHRLFNVSDIDIGKDHKWNDDIVPKCV